MRKLTPLELTGLVNTLREVGIPIVVESGHLAALRSVSRAEAAELLGMSVTWIRQHEGEFPNRWKAGEDVRIPVSDLTAYVQRRRVVPEAAVMAVGGG